LHQKTKETHKMNNQSSTSTSSQQNEWQRRYQLLNSEFGKVQKENYTLKKRIEELERQLQRSSQSTSTPSTVPPISTSANPPQNITSTTTSSTSDTQEVERRRRQEEEDRLLAERLQRELEADQSPTTPPSFRRVPDRRSIAVSGGGMLPRAMVHPRRPLSDNFDELFLHRMIPRGALTPQAFLNQILAGNMDIDDGSDDELGAASYEDLLQLDNRAVRVGVPNSVLQSLPEYKYTKPRNANQQDEGDQKCMVCLDEFQEQEDVRRLPCLHVFHKNCIDNWLKDHRKCPICNFEIPIE
jgi:hypothetical protein